MEEKGKRGRRRYEGKGEERVRGLYFSSIWMFHKIQRERKGKKEKKCIYYMLVDNIN